MKAYQLIAGVFVLIPVLGLTQEKSPVKKDSTVQAGDKQSKGNLLLFKQLDQRKIYHWANGQRSTPAGRKADSDAGKFVRVWGDSARVINAPLPDKPGYPHSGK